MAKKCRYKNPDYMKNWKRLNKAEERAGWLWRKYGLTSEQYDEILTKQNFSCAICKEHMSGFKQALAVDHCHSTGKVRGLLCTGCNTAIGSMKDDTERLRNAVAYLEN